MEGALQALVDREEIRETILRWSRSVDRFDWDALDTVWTHDLRSDFTGLGLPACGAAELKELLRESEKFFSLYQHVLSNLTFHEVTRDTARTSIMVSSMALPLVTRRPCPWRKHHQRIAWSITESPASAMPAANGVMVCFGSAKPLDCSRRPAPPP